jgi:hypothetical protein
MYWVCFAIYFIPIYVFSFIVLCVFILVLLVSLFDSYYSWIMHVICKDQICNLVCSVVNNLTSSVFVDHTVLVECWWPGIGEVLVDWKFGITFSFSFFLKIWVSIGIWDKLDNVLVDYNILLKLALMVWSLSDCFYFLTLQLLLLLLLLTLLPESRNWASDHTIFVVHLWLTILLFLNVDGQVLKKFQLTCLVHLKL